MGCSSSTRNKAGDSSRIRSVTSNECFPTTEDNESCIVQPKPWKMGNESTLSGHTQRESLPPLEKLEISATGTANGVKSLCEHPQTSARETVPDQPGFTGKELADQPGCIDKTQLLEGPQDSGSPQPSGKDDSPETEDEKKDVEEVTAAQPWKGNAETERLGAEPKGQPLKKVGEKAFPATVEGTENPQTTREMKPLAASEKIRPLETAEELQVQETADKDDQPLIPETVPKDHGFSEILEGHQLEETGKVQQLQEEGEDKQSRLLQTIPKENEISEILDRGQLVDTAVENDTLHKNPEVPGSVEQIQPEGTDGNMEHPAGITEAEADEETVREIHINEEDHHIEGETGEKVEAEVDNDRVNEETETKEEETGEAVDP